MEQFSIILVYENTIEKIHENDASLGTYGSVEFAYERGKQRTKLATSQELSHLHLPAAFGQYFLVRTKIINL